MSGLENKVAVVTGSARGIGKAIAERLGSLGADVVINYSSDATSAEKTAAVIQSMGRRAITVQADMTKVDDINRLFDETKSTFGRLDIAVANAGMELIGVSALDFTEEQFDKLFAINTKGAFFTLQRAGKDIADNGRLLYIGSSTTERPVEGAGLYGGSKIAPRYLVEVLAHELGHRCVAVNSIIPTAIDDAGVFVGGADESIVEWVKSFRPMKRMGTVEDVANAVEYLTSDLAGFVSGQHLLLSGGADI